MNIMTSFCPFSKKMVHIDLCMSVGWSVYLDGRFPTACETYLKIARLLRLSNWYPHCIEDLYCSADQGGGGMAMSRSFPTLLLRGLGMGVGWVMFTFTKISVVIMTYFLIYSSV